MTITEMKESIEKVERMTKRGLLTVYEAESRITDLIEEALPDSGFVTIAEFNERQKQRRLANRRKWKFLLDQSKEAVTFG